MGVNSGKFLTSLEGEWLGDNGYKLTKDLVYVTASGKTITVESGFVTDFASVPRVPIAYMLFGNKAHHESTLHDWLYRETPHTCTRKTADNLFLEAMKSRGKSFGVRYCMWLGVRLMGWNYWKSRIGVRG